MGDALGCAAGLYIGDPATLTRPDPRRINAALH